MKCEKSNVCKDQGLYLTIEWFLASLTDETSVDKMKETLQVMRKLSSESDTFGNMKGFQRSDFLESVEVLDNLLKKITCLECCKEIQLTEQIKDAS